jgi:hypothetical protein
VVSRRGNSFAIHLNAVFYNILSANKNDIELIRGLIAEREKQPRDVIMIELKPLGVKSDSSFSDLDAF